MSGKIVQLQKLVNLFSNLKLIHLQLLLFFLKSIPYITKHCIQICFSEKKERQFYGQPNFLSLGIQILPLEPIGAELMKQSSFVRKIN